VLVATITTVKQLQEDSFYKYSYYLLQVLSIM